MRDSDSDSEIRTEKKFSCNVMHDMTNQVPCLIFWGCYACYVRTRTVGPFSFVFRVRGIFDIPVYCRHSYFITIIIIIHYILLWYMH